MNVERTGALYMVNSRFRLWENLFLLNQILQFFFQLFLLVPEQGGLFPGDAGTRLRPFSPSNFHFGVKITHATNHSQLEHTFKYNTHIINKHIKRHCYQQNQHAIHINSKTKALLKHTQKHIHALTITTQTHIRTHYNYTHTNTHAY